MATKMKYTGTRVGADGKERATQRDSAGREWETDPTTGLPQMTPDTVEIERRKKMAPALAKPASSPRTPAVKEMLQEAQDAKDRKKISDMGYKKGGMTKMAKGGSVSSRGDGIAQRGKTRGKMY